MLSELDRSNIQSIYGLTPLQHGMILVNDTQSGSTKSYIELFTFYINGVLDHEILQQSFQLLVNRHDVLRTIFIYRNVKKSSQIVLKNRIVKLKNHDLSAVSHMEQEEHIQKFLQSEKEKGFDLSKDLLIRMNVFQLSENNYQIICSFHHIILDGWSISILFNEWMQYYLFLKNGDVPKFNERNKFQNFIKWLEKKDNNKSQVFWEEYLKGYEERATIPGSKRLGLDTTYCLSEETAMLDEKETSGLLELSKRYKVTTNSIFQAVWGMLLQRYNSQDDVVFGSVVSGRNSNIAQVEDMVGLLINTIPVRVKVDQDEKFVELALRIQSKSLETSDHEHVPLYEIQSLSILKQQLIDHIIVFENYPYNFHDNTNNLLDFQVTDISISEQTQYNFNLIITPGSRYKINISYNKQIYDKQTVQMILNHLINICRNIIKQPEAPVHTIEMMSDSEKNQLLYEFNDTSIPMKTNLLIHEMFQEFVSVSPDKVAIVTDDTDVTYHQLNQKANQLAHQLVELKVARGKKVGILLDRSIETFIATLAVLKAGGTFVPIDPDLPLNRIEYIINDSEISHIITNHVSFNFEKVIKINIDENSTLLNYNTENIPLRCSVNDYAYIIYTSGSTGMPKGVAVDHSSLLNILFSLERLYPLGANGSYLFKTNTMFDVSMTELFSWIVGHGRVTVLENGSEKNPSSIISAIEKHHITHINFVPSMLRIFIMGVSGSEKLSGLRFIFSAGEALSSNLAKEVLQALPLVTLENLYGPTEATVYCTRYSIDASNENYKVKIGKPFDNYKAYILNGDQLCPVGVVGELCISGIGVSAGYINNLKLTNEKFTKNPFNPNLKMYRTGDLAKWDFNGCIEYVGRSDNQVKIRGYRIELDEIKHSLLGHKSINEAVVVLKDYSDIENGTFPGICCYIETTDNYLSEKDIKDYLASQLPAYMLPSHIVFLKDQVPLLSNGKINYKELPGIQTTSIIKGNVTNLKESNAIERIITDIWESVLLLDNINNKDNFFELGGHSINAVEVAYRINKNINVNVTFDFIFNHPTIFEIVQFIQGKAIESQPITKAMEKKQHPVSSMQKRMFILSQYENQKLNYNMPNAFVLEGPIDEIKLTNSINEVIRKNEILRTTFKLCNESPVQIVHPVLRIEPEKIDIMESDLSICVNQFVRPFTLDELPLIRVCYLKIIDCSYNILLLDMHHIISDGVSLEMLMTEIVYYYSDKFTGPAGLQYKDYAYWEKEYIESKDINDHRNYWLEKYKDGCPILELPLKQSRPMMPNYQCESVFIDLGEDLTIDIKNFAAEQTSTVFMILLAAYNILLSKYTDQSDLVVGTPINGRSHSSLESIMGPFTNTLALRNYPKGEKTLEEFVKEVKDNCIQAYMHQSYPFDLLVNELSKSREKNHNPIFDTMFVMQEYVPEVLEFEKCKLSQYQLDRTHSKFDLTVTAYQEKRDIRIQFDYLNELFDRTFINQMSKHFIRIIRTITKVPKVRIQDVKLLSEQEEKLLKSQETCVMKDKRRIEEVFEEQAALRPNNVALTYKGNEMTYGTLNYKAEQFSKVLLKSINTKPIIGIMLDRSFDMFTVILGVLKAGYTYMPIDPSYPEERILYLLNDSRTQTIVTHSNYRHLVPEGLLTVCVDEINYQTSKPSTNYDKCKSSEEIAYILYTSGSTGAPKGVMIEHHSVVSLLLNNSCFNFNGDDIWTFFHSYSFDFSVWEMFGALLNGGKLVIVPKDVGQDPKLFMKLLLREKVTVLSQTPTAFYNLSQTNMASADNELFLTHIMFGGESLSPIKLKKWKEKYPSIRLINLYGITEVTVHATIKEMLEEDINRNINNIGKPLDTATVFIVDKNGLLLPPSVFGELWIAGSGVARGYLNNPELDSQKFAENTHLYEGRIYKTGDIGRWLPNGEIEYKGRKDNQVKIRGHRIELHEIEAQLLKNEHILEAMVVATEGEDSLQELCAYITTNHHVQLGELRCQLLKLVPEYMMPAHFVLLDRFPTTPNGKIDLKALPDHKTHRLTEQVQEAPRNQVEQSLIEVWSTVLGLRKIGVTSNFFELGGDSIKAIQISSRLQEYKLSISVQDILVHPTIRELSPFVKNDFNVADQGITRGEVSLTPIQRSFLSTKCSNKHHFNQSVILFRANGFDENAIVKALEKLIIHHDALRMVYNNFESGLIKQVNQDLQYNLDFTVHHAYDISVTEVNSTINNIQSGINLETGPLLKAALFKTEQGDHLFITIHHLVIDGVSWRIILEDFDSAYLSTIKGQKAELPLKTTSYKAWSEYLIQYASERNWSEEKSFWEKISNLEYGNIAIDHQDIDNLMQNIQYQVASLSESDTNDLLKNVHVAFQTEINDILLLALVKTFKDIFDLQSILINLESHGRKELDNLNINRTVGWFTTEFPVIFSMGEDENLDISDQLYQIRSTLRSIPDQGFNYGVMKFLTPHLREINIQPQISFNYLGQIDEDIRTDSFSSSKWPVGKTNGLVGKREYELAFNCIVKDQKFMVYLEYVRGRFEQSTVANLSSKYIENLKEILKYCKSNLAPQEHSEEYIYKDVSRDALKNIKSFISELDF